MVGAFSIPGPMSWRLDLILITIYFNIIPNYFLASLAPPTPVRRGCFVVISRHMKMKNTQRRASFLFSAEQEKRGSELTIAGNPFRILLNGLERLALKELVAS